MFKIPLSLNHTRGPGGISDDNVKGTDAFVRFKFVGTGLDFNSVGNTLFYR
jgi:hypothetical protein